MGNKALVLIQGISDVRYLDKAILDSNFDTSSYNKVIQVPTEAIFDSSVVNKIPLLGPKYGDIWQYFTQKAQRKKVNREARLMIKKLRVDYDEVDVLSHSLGTIIALTCRAKINTLFCFGSPISFKLLGVGKYVQNHVKKYQQNKEGTEKTKVMNKLYYIWDTSDFVCKYYNKTIQKLLRRHNPIDFESKGSKHRILKYINNFVNQLNIFKKD